MDTETAFSTLLRKRWLTPERLPVLLLPITGLAVAVALLPIGAATGDMVKFFVPWMNAVQEGGLATISNEFAGYTPPYIYLMYVASWLVPWVGSPAAIKLITLPFIAILALAIYQIVLFRRGVEAAPLPPLRWCASHRPHS